MKIVLLTLVVIGLSGCAVPFKNASGTTYHLIIGAGLVTTNSNDTDVVVATRTKALGINISNQPGTKFAIGYSSSKSVAVAEGKDNVVAEIEDSATGDLVVKISQFAVQQGEHENDQE